MRRRGKEEKRKMGEEKEFMQFVPKCCLAIVYIPYKMVSSVPECCLRGITWNQKMLHAVNNKS